MLTLRCFNILLLDAAINSFQSNVRITFNAQFSNYNEVKRLVCLNIVVVHAFSLTQHDLHHNTGV